MGKQRRQLRNYLIDRKVQLKITVVMVLLSSLLTAVLGFIWYAEIRKASDVIRINAIATIGTDAAAELGQELASSDMQRLFVLIGFAVLLGLLIAAYGIVMTHRIAGPIYKITRHMKDVEQGRLCKLWGLRRGDQLQEFYTSFERMHEAVRTRTKEDMVLLNGLMAGIEGEVDVKAQVSRIKAALKLKGDSLQDASEVTQRLKQPDL